MTELAEYNRIPGFSADLEDIVNQEISAIL